MTHVMWRRIVGAIFRAWPAVGTDAWRDASGFGDGRAMSARHIEAATEATQLHEVKATYFAIGEVKYT